jgi:hypothetical protein
MSRSAEEGALVYALDGDHEGLQACLEDFTEVELAEFRDALALCDRVSFRVAQSRAVAARVEP